MPTPINLAVHIVPYSQAYERSASLLDGPSLWGGNNKNFRIGVYRLFIILTSFIIR